MKIITVVGARPQFIKAAAVSRAIAEHNSLNTNHQAQITEVIVHTGQHFDKNMSDVFFEEMQIPQPDYHLNVNSMNHGAMTGKMLEKIEPVLLKEKPDFVIVYGDTNTTLAGALAAKKLHIKVAHVEAGLRSFNMRMPEEINRVLTDRISDILCCPTDKAMENLKREGFKRFPCKMVQTGDVMYDAALFYSDIAGKKSKIIRSLKLNDKDFVLCTIHRAENTDDLGRLKEIISALNEIAEEIKIVLPLHPRTAKIIKKNKIKASFRAIEPVSYFDMIELLKKTKIVMTDSGGLQKEAYFFKKPCVTLRDETEWVELIEKGCNKLAGAEKSRLILAYKAMRGKKIDFRGDTYGNGSASKKIIDTILALCIHGD